MAEHYYTNEPTSDIHEKEYACSISGKSLKFKTVSGVFSFDTKIDKASELLIKNYMPNNTLYNNNNSNNFYSVLDLGCGYGAIGLFLKALYPNINITMVDVNNRAVAYASENSRLNALNAEVLQSDLYSSLNDRKFNDIVTNPPIAAGKKLNTQLIQEAPLHLAENGSLWLVAFHNKGGSTLKEIMYNTFGNVEDMEKSGGIRVYRSVKEK